MVVDKFNLDFDLNLLPVSSYWSSNSKSEVKMHKIHAYPAKFSSLVVEKSIKFAQSTNVKIDTIADIFCGCGTAALEARKNNLDFWGCDINPVATLIAKVKSSQYQETRLHKDLIRILNTYENCSHVRYEDTLLHNPRLGYWFKEKQLIELYKLLLSIRNTLPKGSYRNFFLCAFSNILKGCSSWLTKSIKPQVDPHKNPNDVISSFRNQVHFMIKANAEIVDSYKFRSKSQIETRNFLTKEVQNPFVDVLVTSPPYVTSYEYADLHQLSSIWLGYSEDYRSLRKGSIGSVYYNSIKQRELDALNEIGSNIYQELLSKDRSIAKSVAKYLIDIRKTSEKSHKLLKPNGLAIYVVGNTCYQGVEVDNAKYLCACLLDSGFSYIQIYKRKIGPKILTPYRDEKGKFSNNPQNREVYSHEFVIVGKK